MKWISVKDRLPKKGVRVLLYDYDEVVVGYLISSVYRHCFKACQFDEQFFHVTHWMPLPNPPKEITNEHK